MCFAPDDDVTEIRKQFETRFTARPMALEYLAAYRSLMESSAPRIRLFGSAEQGHSRLQKKLQHEGKHNGKDDWACQIERRKDAQAVGRAQSIERQAKAL